MLGLLQSLASMASIAYPLYRTITQLTALQLSRNKALTMLTDTIPVSRRDTELLQESMAYWVILAFWFYLIQIRPIAILLKILPLSSLATLYFQIWLGFPIIPLGNNVKVSGAFIIYHYYFDNSMRNLNVLKSKFTSIFGKVGVYICEIIQKFPSSRALFSVAGVDVNFYENYFIEMSRSADQTSASGNMASAVFGNGETKVGSFSQYFTSFMTSAAYPSLSPGTSRDVANGPSGNRIPQPAVKDHVKITDSTFIFSSLFAPFGYKLEETDVIKSASSSSFASTVSAKNSKTPSPTRSFDDFAIVSEKDLLDGNDLNAQMNKSKRSNKSKEPSVPRANESYLGSRTSSFEPRREASNASDINTVVNETSGLLASESLPAGKKASSRSGSRSSWFRTSSRG